MSLLYDEGQQAIATQSRRVLDARTDAQRLLALLEQTGSYDVTYWDTAIEQGWTGIALPEAHGGLGLSLIELGLVAQATGAATAGAPFLTTNYGAAQALLASGNPELMARWLPRLAGGEAIGVLAFAERNEPLPRAPRTTCEAGVVTGLKHGVTAGLKGNFAIGWATSEGLPALVFAELGSVVCRAVDSFDNSRLFSDLVFASTPATVLATGVAATTIALDVMARMAVVTAHEQTGGAEALLYAARDYANSRRAFGQPIGAFQSVKHRIAELYALIEIARANCIQAASLEGLPEFFRAAAAARLSATEAYDTAVRDCVQIHGGIGVTWEAGLHLHMRRARSLAIEQGNVLFWEDLLAADLSGARA